MKPHQITIDEVDTVGVFDSLAVTENDMTAVELGKGLLQRFHKEEDGVAMTEYILVFTLLSFGATVSLISVAVYVKGYRDFLVWWLAHPAV